MESGWALEGRTGSREKLKSHQRAIIVSSMSPTVPSKLNNFWSLNADDIALSPLFFTSVLVVLCFLRCDIADAHVSRSAWKLLAICRYSERLRPREIKVKFITHSIRPLIDPSSPVSFACFDKILIRLYRKTCSKILNVTFLIIGENSL